MKNISDYIKYNPIYFVQCFCEIVLLKGDNIIMLQFLKNNIKHIMLKQRLMLFLLIFVQIFSSIVIAFSYGIINHYNLKSNEKESTTLIYDFLTRVLDNGKCLSVDTSEVDKFMNEVLPRVEKKLDYFFIMGESGDYTVHCSSGYKAGHFMLSTQIKSRMGVLSGRKFTDEEMDSNEKIMLATRVAVDEEDAIYIDGEKYKAIGLLSEDIYFINWIYVPYKSIPDNTRVWYISLLFKEPLWESEYKEIASLMTETFGDTFVIPEFDGIVNESSNRVYRDIMLITGFLILVCVVNYCIMYRYLLEKRRREFAITRICGCSRYKAGIVYMIELLGVSVITLVVGLLIYHHFILPNAVEHFSYIGLFYSDVVYRTIVAIYIGILSFAYLVLVCRFVRKTPVALIREV